MRQLRRQLALVTMIVTTLFGPAFPATASATTDARAQASARALALNGPHNIYKVITGKCVDIPGYSTGWVGAAVNEYTCDYGSRDNQLFYVDAYDSTRFVIRNAKDGLCLPLGRPRHGRQRRTPHAVPLQRLRRPHLGVHLTAPSTRPRLPRGDPPE